MSFARNNAIGVHVGSDLQLMAFRTRPGEELLAVDMATDRKAQEEWIALLMERQTGQEELCVASLQTGK